MGGVEYMVLLLSNTCILLKKEKKERASSKLKDVPVVSIISVVKNPSLSMVVLTLTGCCLDVVNKIPWVRDKESMIKL